MDFDLSGLGQFLIGIAAVASVIVNAIVNYMNEKRSKERAKKLESSVDQVHKATNGLSQKLQDMAEARGFEAGHAAAEGEAARDQ